MRRPGYDAERRRRRQFVKDMLSATGTYLGDGLWLANCTLCHRRLALPLAQWTADHVIPIAAGGTESGPLRLSCMRCQRAQGGREGQRRQTHG